MRKLLSLFFALVATTCLWAYDFQSGDLYYNITSDSTVEVTYQDPYSSSNYESLTSIVISETVTNDDKTYRVTNIGPLAFAYCASFSSITIPESIRNISENAFYNNSSLSSITIPNSVTSIEKNAFADCWALTSVTLPNSITTIEESTFWRCKSLNSIIIPNSVTTIGKSAFYQCDSLSVVTIGSGVTTIEAEAFMYCTALSKTNYTGDIEGWCNIKFEDFYANPLYESQNFYILDQEVKDIIIPNTVDSIHKYAFTRCKTLVSAEIEEGVTSIGESAFEGCTSLVSITIPEGVTKIEKYTFKGTSLSTITIPNSVTSIEYQAFYMCHSLKSIDIPSNVTAIGHMAFSMCDSLSSVIISNSLTDIGRLVFYGCTSLSSIIVYEGNAIYDSRENCNAIIETATNTLIIGCRNTTIPSSITTIGNDAFNYLLDWEINSITIPKNVISIGDHAFGTTFLDTMYIEGTIPPILGKNVFESVVPIGYIPCGTLSAYEASDWAQYVGEFVEECEPSNVDNIETDNSTIHKILRDGQLLILRDGKTYSVMGQEL